LEHIDVAETSSTRLQYCTELGARPVSLKNNTLRYEIIVDTSGNINAIESAYELLAQHGAFALVGVTPNGGKIRINPMPLHYGAKLFGVYGGDANPDQDIPKIINGFGELRSRITGMQFTEYSLLDINLAISKMQSSQFAGRVIINPWAES
jgi:Zn-dependent alcohol dehydrogenase